MGVNDRERNRKEAAKDSRRASSASRQQREYSHRFVDLELSEEHKANFKSLLADGEFPFSCIVEFLHSGYTVKFGEENGGKTVRCTVTCSVDGDPNNGLMLTGRGGDYATSLAVCVYKDTYLCDDGVWASGEGTHGKRQSDIG